MPSNDRGLWLGCGPGYDCLDHSRGYNDDGSNSDGLTHRSARTTADAGHPDTFRVADANLHDNTNPVAVARHAYTNAALPDAYRHVAPSGSLSRAWYANGLLRAS